MHLPTALLLCLMIAPFTALAEPAVRIIPDEKEEGCGTNYSFQEDNLQAIVGEENKRSMVFSFCSSYGKADGTLERDANGDLFLLLRYGEGRGINARSEFLSVYKVSAQMIEHVRVPVSGPAGFFSRWFYDYRLSKPTSGGLVLRLLLKVEGEAADWVPSEKQRTITVR